MRKKFKTTRKEPIVFYSVFKHAFPAERAEFPAKP